MAGRGIDLESVGDVEDLRVVGVDAFGGEVFECFGGRACEEFGACPRAGFSGAAADDAPPDDFGGWSGAMVCLGFAWRAGPDGLNDDAIGGYPAAGDSYTTFPVREFWNEVTLVDAVVSDPSHDVIMSGHPDGMQYVVRIT